MCVGSGPAPPCAWELPGQAPFELPVPLAGLGPEHQCCLRRTRLGKEVGVNWSPGTGEALGRSSCSGFQDSTPSSLLRPTCCSNAILKDPYVIVIVFTLFSQRMILKHRSVK